jgi:hypothetical protein
MFARLRTIQSPHSTVVLLLLAFVSLSRLPGGTSTDRSTIGMVTNPATPIAVKGTSQTWHLRRNSDSWSILARPEDSADELSKAIANDAGSVAVLQLARFNRAKGFYDPVRRTYSTRIRGEYANGKPLSDDELRSLIGFLNETRSWDPVPPDSLTYASGEGTRDVSVIQWPAVAHNTLAAIIWLALPISLGWIPRMIRERRAARRLRAGLCPFCAYDRRSTPPEAPCPECGQTPGASTTPA